MNMEMEVQRFQPTHSKSHSKRGRTESEHASVQSQAVTVSNVTWASPGYHLDPQASSMLSLAWRSLVGEIYGSWEMRKW